MALLDGTTALVKEGTTNAETPTLLCWAPSHERRQRRAVVLEIPAMNFIVAIMNSIKLCVEARLLPTTREYWILLNAGVVQLGI